MSSFWMSKIWWCHNKTIYINTEYNVTTLETILFLLAKLVPDDNKMFGMREGFPDIAATPPLRYFHKLIYNNYCQGPGTSFQHSFQSLLNCFGDKSAQRSTAHNWYKEFQFGRTTFEDNAHCMTVATEENVAPVKCLIKKRPKSYTKQDEIWFESVTNHALDIISSWVMIQVRLPFLLSHYMSPSPNSSSLTLPNGHKQHWYCCW